MTYFSKSVFLLAFMSSFAMANTLLDDLLVCAKNADGLQRLVCYDKLTEKTKNNQTKQHKEQQQAEFGQENKQHTENLITQIQATIINIEKAPHGQLIITLDNGQVWRQTDNTRLKLIKEQVIIIKRGAMGSFFIGKVNANKRIRAKRVD